MTFDRLAKRASVAFALAFWAITQTVAMAVTATEVSDTERATVKLHVDHDSIAPGETATIALEQILKDKWHSYWINPGESGMETMIRWTAPDGVEIGAILWPTPQRLPVGDMVNYGFEDHAVLTMSMRAPRSWPVGEPIRLKAEANWLVCRELCVPETQTFTLVVPTAESSTSDPAASRLVVQALAKAPSVGVSDARFERASEALRLTARAPIAAMGEVTDAYFFARPLDVIAPSAPQRFIAKGDRITIETTRSETAPQAPLDGVLSVTVRPQNGGEPVVMAYSLAAVEAAVAPLPMSAVDGGNVGATPQAYAGGVLAAALFAFFGGLILNVMPCVFPVLALKAFAFAKQTDAAPQERLSDGLAYGAGVLISFLAFAAVLLTLRGAGEAVGWGFQLQSPIIVTGLAVILFLVGLNLSGLFEFTLQPTGGAAAQSLAARDGAVGSFFTGVLAALVASPCTAPFMGAALGYALTQPPTYALVVFTALGLGFAAPIIALSASPALGRLLPKPGPWMVRFKEFMAFPMYLAAAWLLWVLGGQLGVDAMFAALGGMVLIALALWVWRLAAPTVGGWPKVVGYGAAALALAAALTSLNYASAKQEARLEPTPFTQAKLDAMRAEGRPVFVNMTADWCVSCKVNEKLVLATDAFAEAMAARGAVYMRGDWTSPNPEISAFLETHGVQSIPLYVYYGPDGAAPEVLPPILTTGLVTDALSR